METSQIGLENDEVPGNQLFEAHQGTRAPMANACTSPRAKTAPMTSGVGTMQYTNANRRVATSDPSVADSPSARATRVSTISNDARLKRNCGHREFLALSVDLLLELPK